MKFTSVAIALLAFAFSARPATVTYTPGTGVLLYPANFFEANSNAIVQAISGAFSGTGSGNASTNAAQGWSASQTFNAPVMFGPTNAVTAIAGKQDLDTDLTDLADGSLTGSKVGTGITADNITAGTLASNRLPAAVSFTTLNAGTINASAVVGDASGLTGINATNITAGELAIARIPTTIARTNAPTLHSPTLLTPSLGVASATSLATGTLLVTSDFVQNSASIASLLGAEVVLDFKWPVSTFAATNNVVVLQSTNRPSAATNVVFSMLRITGDTVDRTISYPAAWKRLGTNITMIPSNKVVLVSGMCIGTAETGVTFGVAKEE